MRSPASSCRRILTGTDPERPECKKGPYGGGMSPSVRPFRFHQDFFLAMTAAQTPETRMTAMPAALMRPTGSSKKERQKPAAKTMAE